MKKVARLVQSWGDSGLLLFLTSVAAIIVANSSFYATYLEFINLNIGMSVKDVVNDLLMAVFFMTVGIEIKREMIEGHLASIKQVVMPVLAASFGVIVPMCIYVALNYGSINSLKGWAIPSATDIAFTLGAMSLLKSYIPTSLKVFVTALAIIDDLIAVLIIALFYNKDLNIAYLTCSLFCFAALLFLSKRRISCQYLYILLGSLLWWCMLKSGVHATMAGVLLGFVLPYRNKDSAKSGMMELFENKCKPWVTYLIVPLFAFVNSDLSFEDVDMEYAFSSVTLGVTLGLFIGKQVGIFGISWLLIKGRLVPMPLGASYPKLYVVSVLCGIGFTMSLFVNLLAFSDASEHFLEAKIGIMAGSLLSLLWAIIVVGMTGKKI